MLLWAARRVVVSLVLIWTVATVVFTVIHLVPGDPAELLLSSGGVAPDPAAVAELRERLGLDRPFLVQYGDFLGRLARGDLGTSMIDDHPVMDEVLLRLPRTLELIAAGAVLAVMIGIPVGTEAALRRGTVFDRATSATAALLLAVPIFVVGTLLVLVFAQWLRWMPAGGYVPLARDPWQHLTLLTMPALAIAKGLVAVVFRMTRAAVLDSLSRDFVRTARAKGLSPARILVHHVVRNAIIPVLTVLALHMGTLLGGTVLVEYVFNWPGLSTPLLKAVEARDYPMVIGIVLTISVLFVALNLVMDLVYAALDPRIRHA
ncbi:ABC transporter permease [Elioraea tepida]|jgi:peptide/nickel transport system permease protein|uniref:ABC transporter permease n=1 Tax=Elioraea tepida TaxID=2843330 RepID=A0A975YIV5_9PROT|nr:ABC transporter permease [Elioraea tepida]QXM23936.1 ABC transporter permease [Elioraea tepida]